MGLGSLDCRVFSLSPGLAQRTPMKNNNNNINNNNEVQKCINFAANVAGNGKYFKRCHVSPLLCDLKWINFNSIVQLNEASFMYKNLDVSADSNVKKINFNLRN